MIQDSAMNRVKGQSLAQSRLRLLVVSAAFCLGCLLIAGRLSYLAMGGPTAPTEALTRTAKNTRSPTSKRTEKPAAGKTTTATPGQRPNIFDRNGQLLATTLPVRSFYANPRKILDPERAVEALAQAFPELDSQRIRARLASNRVEVPIKRDLSPSQARVALNLGLPGFYFRKDDKRFYPAGRLTAHTVGFVGESGFGQAGMERAIDAMPPSNGPVRLSLDLRLQDLMRRELLASIGEFSAIGGAGIIMDLGSGEVLASVSLPDFDPADPKARASKATFNRATMGVYELGSVFKILNTALALDSGAVQMTDAFDARKPIRISRYSIRDFQPEKRWLSVPEIMVHSSNIGSAYMAMATGPGSQRKFMERMGLTRRLKTELPELGTPLVPERWGKVSAMTVAYGHGISVTPLHLASAVGTVVSDGRLMRPTFCRADSGCGESDTVNETDIRLISPQTSLNVRRIMRAVVKHSKLDDADPEGYLLGGKTGTAEKASAGGYEHARKVVSFVGAFPITAPRYLVFAMVDEPIGTETTHGYATGGWVAAPLVGRIVAAMGPMLGVAPISEDDPRAARQLILPKAAKARMVPLPDDPFVFKRVADRGLARLASY